MTDSSNDLNYNGGALPSLSVNVTDPAAALAGLVVSTQSLTMTAGGPGVAYTVALASQPAADVTVTINQIGGLPDPVMGPNGPITPSGGLTITPQTLTFTSDNWDQPQTVTVSAPAGWNGTFPYVSLTETATSDGDANYNNLLGPAVTVNVQNNPAYSLVLSTTSLTLAPGGTTSYTIALASQPLDNVSVSISAANNQFAVTPIVGPGGPASIVWIGTCTLTVTPTTPLIFTPQNWNVAQTVTVTAAANAGSVFELDVLNHTVASDDANWNDISVPPVLVTVTQFVPPVVVTDPIVVSPITINPGPITIDPIVVTSPIPTNPGPGPITPTTGGNTTANTGTSAIQTQTVLTVAPTVAIGQPVTLTAKVTAKGRSTTTPTGTITFEDGSTVLGTGTLSNGVATLQTANLPVGKQTLTAVYAGDDSASTSAPRTATINKATTKVALTASSSPTVFGETVTLTATVSVVAPGLATSTAIVTFKDGSTVLGTGTLNQQGVATLQTSSLAVGTNNLKAVYGGDADTTSSTGSLTETVKKVTTAATLTATLATSTVALGQPITLTASVSAVSPGATTPTGIVTFKVGSTVLGTGTLAGGVATLQTSKLARGKHTVTAVYAGDGPGVGGTSVTLTVTID